MILARNLQGIAFARCETWKVTERNALLQFYQSHSSGSRKRTSEERLQTKISSYFDSSKNALRLILKQTLWLIDSGGSFYSIELPTFHDWMKEIQHPEVSRSLLSQDIIPLLHRAVRMSVFQYLRVPQFEKKIFLGKVTSFSITFDSWSDAGRKNNFVAVTRHWIPNDSWESQSGLNIVWLIFEFFVNSFLAVLDVIPFKGTHTAKRLALEIGSRLLDMEDTLLYCGTTDNAANVVNAMECLLNDRWQEGSEDEVSDEVSDDHESGFRCQDHTLDLAIQKAFSLCDQGIVFKHSFFFKVFFSNG